MSRRDNFAVAGSHLRRQRAGYDSAHHPFPCLERPHVVKPCQAIAAHERSSEVSLPAESERPMNDAGPGPARVLLVDDHPIVRDGLAAVLKTDPMLEVCGCADSAERAYALVHEVAPQLVILDLSLGSDDGARLARRLLVEHPQVKLLLLLTMDDEMFVADRLFAMGAAGYITKSRSVDELGDAVQSVLRGERYVTPEMRDQRSDVMFRSDELSAPELLTARELLVLDLLGAGKTATSIAEDLLIAPKTVYSYRRNIGVKLGLKSGREILRYAVYWSRSRERQWPEHGKIQRRQGEHNRAQPPHTRASGPGVSYGRAMAPEATVFRNSRGDLP